MLRGVSFIYHNHIRQTVLCCFFALLLMLATSRQAEASAGFSVNVHGAKAMGMNTAFAAQADDPSALYYNPAGISFLKGLQTSFGALLIEVSPSSFSGTNQLSPTTPVYEESRRQLFFVPSCYLTYSMESLPLSFGLGINSIYPLSKRWNDNSTFRNLVQSVSIKPMNFQPTVAYRFDSLNLSVAAGIDVTYAKVSMQNMAYAGQAGELGRLSTEGSAIDPGYNFGLLWKPRNDLSFGVNYRSAITLNLSGDATFGATTPLGMAVIGGTQAAAGNATTSIRLPDSPTLAVAWKPIEKLTLEFDAMRTGWSSYNMLEVKYESPQMAVFNNNPIPKNWNDSWSYSLGVQYSLNPTIDLRAGYTYDTTPVPDTTLGPDLPDAARHNYSVGIGIHKGFASVDLAYMYIHFADRSVSNLIQTGTYKSDAHLLGGSITLRF